MYKLIFNPISSKQEQVIRTTDGACIPFDPDNQDFVQYQKWISEGNTPLPADEVTV
jgi:hypothetical protein